MMGWGGSLLFFGFLIRMKNIFPVILIVIRWKKVFGLPGTAVGMHLIFCRWSCRPAAPLDSNTIQGVPGLSIVLVDVPLSQTSSSRTHV